MGKSLKLHEMMEEESGVIADERKAVKKIDAKAKMMKSDEFKKRPSLFFSLRPEVCSGAKNVQKNTARETPLQRPTHV